MKRLVFILVAESVMITFSCKKDNKKVETKPEDSTKTVAQMKTDVANEGVKFVGELKSLNSEKGMVATVNLVQLLDGSGNNSIAKIPGNNVLFGLASYYSGKSGVSSLLKSIRADDPVNIENQFNSVKGVYTYNFTTGEFDSTASSEMVVVKFPASQTSKTNHTLDGELDISAPQYQQGPFTYGDQTVQKMPTTFGYNLKVSDVSTASYSFIASYNTEGIPTSILNKVTVGSFSFNVSASYLTTAATVEYSIKHGDIILLAMGGNVSGNFDKANIDTAEVQNVISNANAYIQIMNIKAKGIINFSDLYSKVNNIQKDVDNKVISNDEGVTRMVNLLNTDAVLMIVYTDTNDTIAQSQFYVKEVTDVDYLGNTITKKELDVQLIFADKSKNSLDV